MKQKTPSRQLVAKTLGAAHEVWAAIVDSLQAEYGDLTLEWKVSKSDFGWVCVLKQKKRTVVYLTPEDGAVRVAVVLGERAAALAQASDLPNSIKVLISDARPYAEGRGIRFLVRTIADLPIITELIAMKMGRAPNPTLRADRGRSRVAPDSTPLQRRRVN